MAECCCFCYDDEYCTAVVPTMAIVADDTRFEKSKKK